MHLSAENISYLTEVVIFDTESALRAHRELFRFSKHSYIHPDNANNAFPLVANLIEACNASALCPPRIHLALRWENMLKVAAWMDDFSSVKDAFIALKNAGVTDSELASFAISPIRDLFPYLYYGKRIDVLKKVCVMARKQVESRVRKCPIRVDCHIIAEDSPHVIASSL